MKRLHRILSFFLAVLMIVSVMPVGAFADEDTADDYPETVGEMSSGPDEISAPPIEEEDPAFSDAEAPEPEATPEPTMAPATTPEPEVTPEPVSTPEPEATPEPETTLEPEVTPEPEELEELLEEEEPDEELTLEAETDEEAFEEATKQEIPRSSLVWSLHMVPDGKGGEKGVLTIEPGAGGKPDAIPTYNNNADATISRTSFTTAPWYRQRGYINEIVIEQGVTSIGAFAFWGVYSKLTTMTVAASVKSIGEQAFYNVNSLETINWAAGSQLTTIGNKAFYNTKWQEKQRGFVVAGNTLILYLAQEDEQGNIKTHVTEADFAQAEAQSGADIKIIGDNAFYKNENITQVDLPDDIEIIGDYAFYRCTELITVNIPRSLTSLGASAFYNCSALTNVNISSNNAQLQTIGDKAFHNCTNLSTFDFNLAPELTGIGNYAFYNCSALPSVTIGNKVTGIGNYAFRGCVNITSIKFPSSVRTIGTHAFTETSLTNIIFDFKGVGTPPSIGADTFNGITATAYYYTNNTDGWEVFTESSYGGSITWIGEGDIVDATGLKWSLSSDHVLTIKVATAGSTVAMADYTEQNRAPWYSMRAKVTSVVVESGVTTIGAYAFKDFANMTSISIPASVTRIGAGAFKKAASLTTVTFAGTPTLTEIQSYAFEDCAVLENFSIPGTVRVLGAYSFSNCAALPNVVIPIGVSQIPEYCFRGCASLSSVDIPYTVTNIGAYAFYNCTDLLTVTIGDGPNREPAQLVGVGPNAFVGTAWYNSDGGGCVVVDDRLLTYVGTTAAVIIPSTVRTIQAEAFASNEFITSVTIPATVTTIQDSAFEGCARLTTVTITAGNGSTATPGLQTLAPKAFKSCTALTAITVPSGTIGANAFEGCRVLASADVNGSVATDAFLNCAALNNIKVRSGAIASYAFDGCTADNISLELGAGVASVGESAFAGTGVKAITIKANPGTTIAKNAFYGCSGLATITMTDGGKILDVGETAFGNCRNLASAIVVSGGAIGANAFTGSKVTGITATNISGVAAGAFNNCAQLATVSLSGAANMTVASAFNGCTGLTSVTIGSGTIANGAFSGCTGSAFTLTLGAGVTSIGTSAFENTKVSKLSTAATALVVNGSAFKGCTSLTAIERSGSGSAVMTTVDASAFQGCTNLASLTNVTLGVVNTNAFQGCAKLASAITVTGNIAANAFTGTAITGLTLAGTTAQSIASNTASGVTTLKTVTVNAGATANFAASAFEGCTGMTALNCNGTITGVGNKAFYNTRIATAVKVDSGAIGTEAFRGGAITAVTIGAGVTSIGTSAFHGMSTITSLTINATALGNASTLGIGADAFNSCTGISTVTIASTANITGVGDRAFYCCTNLPNFTVKAGAIGASAFESVTNLGTLTLAEGVTSIGAKAFKNAGKHASNANLRLRSVTIPASVTTIGDEAFCTCSYLATVNFTKNANTKLTTIGTSAFHSCPIATVAIPKQVTTIGATAFYANTAMQSLTFESGSVLNSIGASAFQGCNNASFQTVVVPETVTTAGNYVFYGCSNLKTVTLGGGAWGIETFNGTGIISLTLGPNVTALGNKSCVSRTSLVSVTVRSTKSNGVTLGAECFNGCSNLTTLDMKDGGMINGVGDNGFLNCQKLVYAEVANGSLGYRAFYNCYALRTVTIGTGTVNGTVGTEAFRYCNAMTRADIGPNITVLGNESFCECKSLEYVTFLGQSKLTSLNQHTFYECNSLRSIVIPASVTQIGYRAFYWDNALASFTIQEGSKLELIGGQAFYHCDAIEKMELPASCKSVSSNAFQYCNGLRTFVLPYFTAMADLNNIVNLTVLEGSIAAAPLSSFGSLKTLTLGDKVTNISAQAFNNASVLERVTFLGAPPVISPGAFNGCKAGVRGSYPAAYASQWTTTINTSNSQNGNTFYGGQSWVWDGLNGSCGVSGALITWNYTNNDKALTITGSGAMTNFTNGAAPWQSYMTAIQTVSIGEGITSVGNYAFRGATALTKATLGPDIATVGEGAFQGCTALTTLEVFGDTFTSQGSNAFATGATTHLYYLSGYATRWGSFALTGISIPAANRHVMTWLSGNISNMYWSVFDGLLNVTIVPGQTGSLTGYSASSPAPWVSGNKYEVTRARFASGITINTGTLEGLALVEKVTTSTGSLASTFKADFGSGWTLTKSISNAGASGGMTTYQITGGDLNITTSDSFAACGTNGGAPWNHNRANITTVVSTANADLPAGALYRCSSVQSVTLPNNRVVTGGGFVSVSGPTGSNAEWELTVPLLKSVDGSTEDVFTPGGSNYTITFIGVNTTSATTATYRMYDIGEANAAYCRQPWIGYKAKITKVVTRGIQTLGRETFYANYDAITELDFDTNLRYLGYRCFQTCRGITNVKLPAGFIGTDSCAFESNSNIRSVEFPNSLNYMYSWTFSGTNLTQVVFGNSTTLNRIDDRVFHGNTNLCSVVYKGTTKPNSLGSLIFTSTKVRNIYVTSAYTTDLNTYWGGAMPVKRLYNDTAYGMCGDTMAWAIVQRNDGGTGGELILSGSGAMTSTPWTAAAYKDSITKVTVSESIGSIMDNAFSGCTNLNMVDFKGATRPTIGANTFSGRTFTAKYVQAYSGQYGSLGEKWGNASKITWNATGYSGDVANGVTWKIESGKLTITATSANTTLPNFVTNDMAPWYPFRSSITSLQFVNCANIPAFAFNSPDYRIKSYTTDDCIKTLGNYCFASCTYLEEFYMKDTVSGGAYHIFESCTGLKKLRISGHSSYTNIGESMIYNCDSLKALYLPSNIKTTDGWSAIRYCDALITVYGPGLQKVGCYALAECTKLRYVSFPSVNEVYHHGFYNCDDLGEYDRPTAWDADVKAAMDYGMQGHTVPQADAYVGTSYEAIYMPALVTIQYCGFYSNNHMKKLSLPACQTIQYQAFYDCTCLQKANLPEVRTIQFQAFYNGDQLKSVYMPKLTTLQYQVFQECDGITKVVRSLANWNTEGVQLPNTLTSVGANTFLNCRNITSAEWPNASTSVKLIPDYTFDGCTKLATFIIPDTVNNVGAYAFRNTLLQNINIPTGLTNIGDYMFYGVKGLTTFTVPSWVNRVGSFAFQGCTSLTKVEFSAATTSIGTGAFDGCTSLRSVLFPVSTGTSLTNPGNYYQNKTMEVSTTAFAGRNGLICYYYGTSANKASWMTNTFGGANVVWQAMTEEPKTEATIPNPENPSQPITVKVMWMIDSAGNLTISGEDPVPTFTTGTYTSAPWYAKRNDVKTVTIEGSVKTVGNYAFYKDYPNLETITLAGGITSVGNGAFQSDAKITTVSMPNTLTTIGTSAFQSVGSTGSGINLTIPTSVTSMGNSAFESAKVTALTFPANATLATIPSRAFYGCSSMGTFSMGANSTMTTISASAFQNAGTTGLVMNWTPASKLTTIGDNAFAGNNAVTLTFNKTAGTKCTSVSDSAFSGAKCTTLTLPDGMTTLKSTLGCTALTTLTLPDSMITINDSAMASATNLATVDLNKVQSIGANAFKGTKIANLTIPATIKTIGASAFQNCTSLKTVTIAENASGMTTLGASAFQGCSAVTAFTINRNCGMTSIGASAFESFGAAAGLPLTFANCAALTSIGNNAFKSSTVTSLTFSGTPSATVGTTPYDNCQKLVTLNLPKGTTTVSNLGSLNHMNALTTVVFPGTVTTIANNCFEGNTALTTVTLAEGLQTIGISAFRGCTGIKTMKMPNSLCGTGSGASRVPGIGNTAFENCTNLERIEFTSGSMLNSIGQYAFRNTPKLSTIVGFANCTRLSTVETNVFANSSISEIDLPEGMTAIQEGAFSGSKLYNLNVANTVTTIAARAFSGCNEFNEIKFTDGSRLASIGDQAFESTSIRRIDLSKCTALVTVGNKAFHDCQELRTIKFSNTALTSVGSEIFTACRMLQELKLPEGWTEVANLSPGKYDDAEGGTGKLIAGTGDGLNSLYSVTIPSTAESIAYRCFKDSKNLDAITFNTVNGHTSMKSIGHEAFQGCTQLESIQIPGGVTAIGKYAFSGTAIRQLDLSALAITNLDARLNMPAGLSTDQQAAYIPANYFGEYVFDECSALLTAALPNTLPAIPTQTFHNCANLTGFVLPPNIAYIASGAFMNTNLESIVIPASVAIIEANAFEDCGALATVTFGDPDVAHDSMLERIGVRAFAETGITHIDFDFAPSITRFVMGEDVFLDSELGSDPTIEQPITGITHEFYYNNLYFGRPPAEADAGTYDDVDGYVYKTVDGEGRVVDHRVNPKVVAKNGSEVYCEVDRHSDETHNYTRFQNTLRAMGILDHRYDQYLEPLNDEVELVDPQDPEVYVFRHMDDTDSDIAAGGVDVGKDMRHSNIPVGLANLQAVLAELPDGTAAPFRFMYQDEAPTCDADGVQTWECTCHYTTKVADPMVGHTIKKIQVEVATCTEAGNQDYYRCTDPYCLAYLLSNNDYHSTWQRIRADQIVVPALGHTRDQATDQTPYLEPTCTQVGNIEYWTCHRVNKGVPCGHMAQDAAHTIPVANLEATVIQPLKHDLRRVITSTDGDTYYQCKRCLCAFDSNDNTSTEYLPHVMVLRYDETGNNNVVVRMSSTASIEIIASCPVDADILAEYIREQARGIQADLNLTPEPAYDENGRLTDSTIGYDPMGHRFDYGTFMTADPLRIVEIEFDSVPSIEDGAFVDCGYPRLEKVSADNKLKTLGIRAFYGNSKLKAFDMPGLTNIGAYAFSGCALEELNLSSILRQVDAGAFENNSRLKHVTIPNGTLTLGNNFLNNCPNLEDITYNGVFDDFAKIYSKMPYRTTIHFNKDALAGFKVSLMGDGTLRILSAGGANAGTQIPPTTNSRFSGLNYTSVEIGPDISTIADGAFLGKGKLTKVTLTTDVTLIGANAFTQVGDTVYLNADGEGNGTHLQWFSINIGAGNEKLTAGLPKAIKDHSTVYQPMVDSTCSSTGHVAYWKCSVCERNFKESTAKNEIAEPDFIAMKPHSNWEDHREFVTNCSGNSDSIIYSYCKDCGQYFTDRTATVQIQQLQTALVNGHRIHLVEEIIPNCVHGGNLAYYECDYCGDLFSDVDATVPTTLAAVTLGIDPVAHTIAYEHPEYPTCTGTGLDGFWYCTTEGCGKMFDSDKDLGNHEITERGVLPPTGHQEFNLFAQIDPTCSTDGIEAYWQCKRCSQRWTYDGDYKYDLLTGALDNDTPWIVSVAEGTDRLGDPMGEDDVPASIPRLRHCSVDEYLHYLDASGNVVPADSTAKVSAITHQDGTTATCSSVGNGMEEHWLCATCGNRYLDKRATVLLYTVFKEKLKHEMVSIENGDYEYCANCKEMFERVLVGEEPLLDENGEPVYEDGYPVMVPVYEDRSLPGVTQYIGTEESGLLFTLEGDTVTVDPINGYYRCANIRNPYYGMNGLEDVVIRKLVVRTGITLLGPITYLDTVEEVIMAPSVTRLLPGAFSGWRNLKTIDTSYIIDVGDRAFEGCTSLPSLLTIRNFDIMGSYVYANSSITQVVIPIGCAPDQVGDHLFLGCDLEEVIYHDELNAWIGIRAGTGTGIGNPELNVPGLVTFTNRNLDSGWSFDFTDGIVTLVQPAPGATDDKGKPYSREKLPELTAFAVGIMGGRTLIIPEGVTKITRDDVRTVLLNVEIPSTIREIEDDAFDTLADSSEDGPVEGVYAIEHVTYNGSRDTWETLVAKNPVLNDSQLTVTYLQFFPGIADAAGAQSQNEIAVEIDTDATTKDMTVTITGGEAGVIPDIEQGDNPLARLADQNPGEITAIVIGEGIKEIGSNLLEGLASTPDVIIPEGVERIGDNVLQDVVAKEKANADGQYVYILPSTVSNVGADNFGPSDFVLLDVTSETYRDTDSNYRAILAQNHGLTEANFWVRGDAAAHDGLVTLDDALFLAKVAIESEDITSSQDIFRIACDINRDHVVDIVDAMLAMRMYYGIDYPAGSGSA